MIKDYQYSKTITAGSTDTLFSLYIPQKSKMVLKKFANYLSDPTYFGFVIWQFFVNGIAVYPYENISDMIGLAYQPADIENIEIGGGSLFEIKARNNHSSDLGVGIRFIYEIL